MLGSEPDRSSLLSSANPHRSRAADQREWIVSDDFCGTFEAQRDGIIRVRSNRTEFICDAEHDARGVGPIGPKLRVIGMRLRISDPRRGLSTFWKQPAGL